MKIADSHSKDPELAQIKAHPGVIVFGCFLASVFARHMWQLDLAPEILAASRYIGLSLEVVGLAVLIFSYTSMARAKTTIDPSQHSSKVVTTGLYAYSRNPIYLGWFLLIAGIGFRNGSLFVLLIAVTMILLLYWAVVIEEEKYLERKFGEEYLSYKKSVRRWL
jgi:protein-S-isoprenylcysteine O-methyltransferase Ste14